MKMGYHPVLSTKHRKNTRESVKLVYIRACICARAWCLFIHLVERWFIPYTCTHINLLDVTDHSPLPCIYLQETKHTHTHTPKK